MPGLNDLYQEILLEHNSKPRNFRKVDDANRSADGYNPLCGDQIQLYLKVEDDTIVDVGFQGTGCAISRASASMLTQSVKGQSVERAQEIFDAYISLKIAAGERWLDHQLQKCYCLMLKHHVGRGSESK